MFIGCFRHNALVHTKPSRTSWKIVSICKVVQTIKNFYSLIFRTDRDIPFCIVVVPTTRQENQLNFRYASKESDDILSTIFVPNRRGRDLNPRQLSPLHLQCSLLNRSSTAPLNQKSPISRALLGFSDFFLFLLICLEPNLSPQAQ